MKKLRKQKQEPLNASVSLPKTFDNETVNRLTAQRLDRYMHRVSNTRQFVDMHFQEKLEIPTTPCLDILLALQIASDEPKNVKGIANHIRKPLSLTLRYLDLMSGKGLIDVDEKSVRLTSAGLNELTYIIEKVFAISFELVD